MVNQQSFSRILFRTVNTACMIALSFLFIAPLWHVAMSSLSSPRELMASSGLLLKPVGQMTLDGYRLVFKNASIATGYVNTLIYVVGTTFLGTVLTLLGGYVTSRKNLKLSKPITLFILFTMMFSGGLIPSYIINRSLGLVNNRLALLIPGCTNAFFIFMMKSAFEQLPESFEESARIDGAKPLTILLRILAPLIKATSAVVIMFNVVMQWNSWFPASIYLTQRRDLWPLQLFMREILVQNDTSKVLIGADALSRADFTSNLVKFCVTIVGTLPVLCIYPFAQKYFVTGVTLGGVKG